MFLVAWIHSSLLLPDGFAHSQMCFVFFKRVENEHKKVQRAKRAFCALLRIHVQQQQKRNM